MKNVGRRAVALFVPLRHRLGQLLSAPAWVPLVAILAVYAALFVRSVSYEFVWDDRYNIVDNSFYDAPLSEALRATQHDHLDPTLRRDMQLRVPFESYRPLLFLSYIFDDRVGGRSPAFMHLHGLILGAVGIVLAWLLFREILGPGAAATAATALFALHPLQVEPVCYVSARSDLLSGAFGLMGVLACLRGTRSSATGHRYAWAGAAGVAFVLSLFSKEASLALPLAVVALVVALRRERAALVPLLGLCAGGLVYLGLRLGVVGTSASAVEPAALFPAFLSVGSLTFEYVRVFAVPFDLSIERMAPAALPVAVGWLGLALAAGLGLAARFSGHPRAREAALASAGLGWLAACIAPSAIGVETTGVIADRYAYLGMVGAVLATVALSTALVRTLGERPILWAGGAWAASLGMVTLLQVGVWDSNDTLYANSVLAEPASPNARYRLGVVAARQKSWDRASELFERAIELDPGHFQAWGNLGVAYTRLGRPEEARRALERAISLAGGRHFRAWSNLARLHFARGDAQAGCRALERSLDVNPGYETARRNYDRLCPELVSG